MDTKKRRYPDLFSEAELPGENIADTPENNEKIRNKLVNSIKTLEDRDKKHTFGDKVGAASDLAKIIDQSTDKLTINSQSIVRRARNSILQFPIYISRSLTTNPAYTIGKTMERIYATLVQSVLAQRPIIDPRDVNDLRFIKQFHTNIAGTNGNISNVLKLLKEEYIAIDDFDQMLADSVFHEETIEGLGTITFHAIPTVEYLNLESARLANEPLKGFRYLSEAKKDDDDDKDDSKSEDGRGGAKAKTKSRGNEKIVVVEDRVLPMEELDSLADKYKISVPGNDSFFKNNPEPDRNDVEAHKKWEQKLLERRRRIFIDEIKKNEKEYRARDGLPLFFDTKDRAVKARGYSSKTTDYTSDSDSKNTYSSIPVPKITNEKDFSAFNSMAPYTIVATFRLLKDFDPSDKRYMMGTDLNFILGVKGIMHPININDLTEDIRDIIDGDQKNLRKIKYKTGEITAIEYLLNLKELKRDASKNLNGKRWLNTLKRLGEYEKLNGSLLKGLVAKQFTGGAVPIPNATLVINRSDVSRILNVTGIDLENTYYAKTLARRLFLIAIVIDDPTAGVVKTFFPDMDEDWGIQAYGALSDQISKMNNNSLMDEVNKLMNR